MVTECDVTDCTAPAEATAYSPRVNESFEYCSDHVKVMLDRFTDLELVDTDDADELQNMIDVLESRIIKTQIDLNFSELFEE